MSVVWDSISVLFYISLAMVAASVFTPRTALFFKDKTRLRGAIIWLSCVLVFGVLTSEFAPKVEVPELEVQANATEPAPVRAAPKARPALPPLPEGLALPPHEVDIVSARPGERLALEGRLAEAVDAQTLRALSIKAIADKKGRNYDTVSIAWYLTGQSREQGPFAEAGYEHGELRVHMAKPEIPAQWERTALILFRR